MKKKKLKKKMNENEKKVKKNIENIKKEDIGKWELSKIIKYFRVSLI